MSNKAKTTIVRRTIETVTGFLTTKNSLYTTVITILAVVAPFLHLLAKSGQPGLFGYKWMTSFLFALGWPITTICMGLLLYMASEHIEGEMRKGFALISTVIIGLGMYYLMYTLIPMDFMGINDFPVIVYYLVLLLCSIAAIVAVRFLNKGIKFTEAKLKANVSRLIAFIINGDKYIETEENRTKYFKDYMGELDELSK